MSGLAGTPDDPDPIYGVSYSFLAIGFISQIDTAGAVGVIIDRIEVTDPNGVTDSGKPAGRVLP